MFLRSCARSISTHDYLVADAEFPPARKTARAR